MQTDLLVNAFANDMARIGSLQFTNSVGNARMRWLGIEEWHHGISHDPDLNEPSQEKLLKINVWFAQRLAMLAKKLADTPKPGGSGSMLDHTTILWTNELGFKSGRSLQEKLTPHNRLWLSVAHAFGHPLKTFGSTKLCEAGPLSLTT